MLKLMFYERPVVLDRRRHQGLKLSLRSDHYRFSSRTNAIPLTAAELPEAARDLPVVFVGGEGRPFGLAALVGLRDQENLLVDADGRWAPERYVPAFVRRYPFVLAPSAEVDRFSVCVDEGYPGLGREQGEALFEADGQETPYLRRVLQFLQAFHAEAGRTSAFAQRMHELDLLVPKVIGVEHAGQPTATLRGVWTVDAEKLRALPEAKVVELHRSGELAWIEAHRLSLGHVAQLAARLNGRPGGEGALANGGLPAT